MFEVYGMSLSGNCYKVKLLLEYLKLPYLWHEVDTKKKETRSETFLAMNPNGKIPVLKLEENKFLPESNAILFFLAQNSEFWPQAAFLQAQALQWMFFEQYTHEPYIAVNRAIKTIFKTMESRGEEYQANLPKGHAALAVMEFHLRDKLFFVDDRFSIADIALYAYTHVAEEGGFELAKYPAILSWLERIENRPDHFILGRK